MAQFNVHDAKSNLSRLLDMALEGEEVLISRHGLAVAQLTAIRTATGERILGSGRSSVTILSPDWDKPATGAGM
jgi:antitoxin (DNA-binding transcriptional repressor) of toxin-antitoxin stability system